MTWSAVAPVLISILTCLWMAELLKLLLVRQHGRSADKKRHRQLAQQRKLALAERRARQDTPANRQDALAAEFDRLDQPDLAAMQRDIAHQLRSNAWPT